MKAELYIDARATLGEGPCWDARSGKLYWVDIINKKIHIHDVKAKTNEEIAVDHLIGAVVLCESGELLAATQNGFYKITEQGVKRQLVDPEAHLPDNRFNDGKCDPAGRFWAGTMHINEKEPTGSLYMFDHDETVRTMQEQITISNGLAWSADRKTMYYIDSPTLQVVAFDYDLETGDLSNKRTAITIPDGEGVPDGMTIDLDGNLWVAQFGGYKVSKWNPTTGEKLDEVQVPAKQVTSCAFGGEHLDELFITSANVNLSEEELTAYPHSGSVFRVKTNTKGEATFLFRDGGAH